MCRYQSCGEEAGCFDPDLGLTLDLGMEETSETRCGLLSSDDMPLSSVPMVFGWRRSSVVAAGPLYVIDVWLPFKFSKVFRRFGF